MNVLTQPAGNRTRFWMLAALGCLLMLWTAPVMAQPPARIHYQGVLVNNLNQPITTQQTAIFSIWKDPAAAGATTANSGTKLYQEQANVVPDGLGIFEHQVGSGAVQAGSLDPALFVTADPLYLQVQIGASILLPRARITSVGYAFVAGNAVGDITPKSVSIPAAGTVINAQGQWVGPPISAIGLAGSPTVSSITDATGGLLVVGDLLTIAGGNLTNATVMVGGKPAPIVSRTATQIQCQVPAGVPMGLNAVTLAATSGSNGSITLAHLNVHRLIAAVRSSGTNAVIDVIDAADGSLVTEISGMSIRQDAAQMPLQGAMTHQGALLLVPSNNGNTLYAIDLTANPPRLADSASIGNGAARAVVVSDDGTLGVVCQPSNNNLTWFNLNETRPPYTNNVLGNWQNFLDSPPNGFGPRAAVFVGNSQLIVVGESAGQLRTWRRSTDLPNQNQKFEFVASSDLPPGMTNAVSVGTGPVSMQLTPDATRLMLVTRGQTNLSVLPSATFWDGTLSLGSGSTGGTSPLKMALSPNGHTVFVAGNTVSPDLLYIYFLNGTALTKVGAVQGPEDFGTDDYLQLAAIEPVNGELLAVATSKNRLFLTPCKGSAVEIGLLNNRLTDLTLTNPLTFSGTFRQTIELLFQP